jgi:hypothetical protein
MSLFGALLPSLQVERAAYTTLKTWMRDYLGEVCVQDGLARNFLQVPKSYPTASQFGKAEDQLPSVGIHVPGLSEAPYQNHDGEFWTKWRLEVGALVSANSQINTDRMSKLYGAAIFGCLMQHPSLGGVATHLSWLTEDYGITDTSKDRSLAFAVLTFEVEVRTGRSSFGGPSTPTNPTSTVPVDYGDWPTVSSVVLDLTSLPDVPTNP